MIGGWGGEVGEVQARHELKSRHLQTSCQGPGDLGGSNWIPGYDRTTVHRYAELTVALTVAIPQARHGERRGQTSSVMMSWRPS